jgi:hypothetical protein
LHEIFSTWCKDYFGSHAWAARVGVSSKAEVKTIGEGMLIERSQKEGVSEAAARTIWTAVPRHRLTRREEECARTHRNTKKRKRK